jgi:tetratricopeptide (TPR) repeat protein
MSRALRDAIEVFGESGQTVGFIAGNLAAYQLKTGDVRGALENSNRSLAILERHAEPGSYPLAQTLTNRGVIWLAARRGAEALQDLTAAVEAFQALFGPSHRDTIVTRIYRAEALAYLGRTQEAQKELQPVEERSPHVDNRSWALYVLGVVRRLAGDPEGALRAHEESLALIPEGRLVALNQMRAFSQIGLDQVELGRHDKALESLGRAQKLSDELRMLPHPAQVDVLVGRGRAHLARHEADRALPLLEEADRFWRDFDAGNRWAGEAAFWLGRCYAALGRSAEASAARARAQAILSRSRSPADSKPTGGYLTSGAKRAAQSGER